MAKKNIDIDSEKDLAFNTDNEMGFKPKKLNTKKIIIGWSIFVTIVTGIVLIWLYVIKGKDFLEYRQYANKVFHSVFVEPKKEEVEKMSFVNEQLKTSTVSLTETISQIYNQEGGFDYTPESGTKIENYKYVKNKLETINLSKTDYVFGFVDKKLEDLIAKEKNHQTMNNSFTWRIAIRITDGKISAIGLRTTDNNLIPYNWLTGSITNGIRGGH